MSMSFGMQTLLLPQKTTKKVRQRVHNALRRADWLLPHSRCADTQGPWSSPQLWMNMSPHRPTGKSETSRSTLTLSPSFHLHHVQPTQQQTPILHPIRGS